MIPLRIVKMKLQLLRVLVVKVVVGFRVVQVQVHKLLMLQVDSKKGID